MEHDFSKARSMGANAFPSVVIIDEEFLVRHGRLDDRNLQPEQQGLDGVRDVIVIDNRIEDQFDEVDSLLGYLVDALGNGATRFLCNLGQNCLFDGFAVKASFSRLIELWQILDAG